MSKVNPNGRTGISRAMRVHPLVILNPKEAKRKCWRTDVSDEAWEAGQAERFETLLGLACKKRPRR